MMAYPPSPGIKRDLTPVKQKIVHAATTRSERLYIHGEEDGRVTDADLKMICEECPDLKELEITSCELQDLPEDIKKLTKLERLLLRQNELTKLPKCIEQMSSLREVNLRLNKFKTLPNELVMLPNLQMLDVAFNQIADINFSGIWGHMGSLFRGGSTTRERRSSTNPPFFSQLLSLDLSFNPFKIFPVKILDIPNLESLTIGRCSFESMPVEIQKLAQSLHTLKIPECKFKVFPASIFELENLHHLDLSHTDCVSDFPSSAASLMPYITHLDISHCSFKSIETIRFRRLVYLNAEFNQIQSLPSMDLGMIQLQTLKLGRNQIRKIPREFMVNIELIDLDMSRNALEEIDPQAMGSLFSLQKLNFEMNSLEYIPETIENLTMLKKINFCKNKLKALPKMHKWKNLVSLKASSNLIENFPEGLSAATGLRKLQLNENALHSIHTDVYQLKNLEELMLVKNKISEISDDVGNLVNLRLLDLSFNSIQEVPDSLSNLTKLQELSLNQNGNIALSDKLQAWQQEHGVKIKNDVELPDKICDKLYISSARGVSSKLLLQSMGITHILTAAREIDPVHPQVFQYCKLDIDDTAKTDIKSHFYDSFKFIDEGRSQGGCVIHCLAGVSRSSTIAVAYLMYSQKIMMRKAFQLVKRARPCVFPNPGFGGQLNEFEKELLASSHIVKKTRKTNENN